MMKSPSNTELAMLVRLVLVDGSITELQKWLGVYTVTGFTLTKSHELTITLEVIVTDHKIDSVLENLRRAACMHNRVLRISTPAKLTYSPVTLERITGDYV